MNRYFYEPSGEAKFYKIQELIDIMYDAIQAFNDEDVHLYKNDFYEVAMAHCLAQHITLLIHDDPRFEGMFADIEYNRGAHGNDSEAKRLTDERLIRLDVAVTNRVNDNGYHNLICIEIKKEKNTFHWNEDRERLKMLTYSSDSNTFGYFLGLFIAVNRESGMRIENAYGPKGELHWDSYSKRFFLPKTWFPDIDFEVTYSASR